MQALTTRNSSNSCTDSFVPELQTIHRLIPPKLKPNNGSHTATRQAFSVAK
jgi:hypothetical protein